MKTISISSILKDNWKTILAGLTLVLMGRILGLALPLASRSLIDDILIPGKTELLTSLIGVVLVASLLQGIFSRMSRRLISIAGQDIVAKTRKEVHAYVLKFPTSYFDSNKSGNLVKRVLDDAYDIKNLIGTGLLSLFGASLTAIFAFCLMFALNVKLTILTVIGIGIFAASLSLYIRRVLPISIEEKKIQAAVSGRLTECMAGIRVIKSYRAEPEEEKAFGKGVDQLREICFETIYAFSNLTFIVSFGIGAISAGIMYIGAIEIAAKHLTIGGLFSYLILLGLLIEPIMHLVGFGETIGSSYAAMKRIQELFNEKTEYENEKRTEPANIKNGDIEFRNVSFAYDKGTILHNLSFRASGGSVTALVGPSGSGKSTIVGLLALLYSPKEGQILVDGQNLDSVTIESYRQNIGLVSQDTFLFDGTIRENVLYARPHSSEAELFEACRLARVDEFVDRLENQYDTVVGERGIKLSGGQKQRISIARAILANSKILLLDEATSSLDTESEQYVQDALADLMRDRTTFVVAHRLSTIKDADQILVIEHGRITESGTHDELLDQEGRFAEMWNRQSLRTEPTKSEYSVAQA